MRVNGKDGGELRTALFWSEYHHDIYDEATVNQPNTNCVATGGGDYDQRQPGSSASNDQQTFTGSGQVAAFDW